ncbi:unnamed protein product [Adineta steineri]|uniref:Uncharacterized protein n=1 Tax=Adineta steineri TaxID=433720 RepID=A0A815MWM4_9BILA|nr:unnamed protein product [Adineta steineri]CAF1421687.1 unnamed protein product [Adineta steineri]
MYLLLTVDIKCINGKAKHRLSIIILLILILFLLSSIIAGLFFGLKKDKKNLLSDDKCELDHESYSVNGSSKLGKYDRAAVAVDNEECSKIGKSILLKGGKAVDAAIASSLCNGILNAHSMGIGGGCVLIIYSKKHGKAFSIVEREKAPLNSNKTMFQGRENMSLIGALSIGTPGELLAYRKAYELFGGGVSWSTLFQPTIRLCEKGFNVSRTLAFAINQNKKHIINDTQLREIFLKNNLTNELYGEGDLMKRIKLGKTLRQISQYGIKTFYSGNLSHKIISEIQKRGGILTLDDLRQYDLDIREALSINLNNSLKAFTSSSPSSGPILALILQIILGYKFESNDLNHNETASLFYHRLIESFKFAFAKQSNLGDPQQIHLKNFISNLTSQQYANLIRQKINDLKTFDEEYYKDNNNEIKTNDGTAHISIVDQYGDAVAITSTINTYFGSMIVGEETGIIYNNEMNDFSISTKENYHGLKFSKNNFISPGKRPISSQSPLIIIDNNKQIRLVIGASGGSKILTSIAHVTLLNLLFNKNIKESIDHSRIHHHLSPNQISFERNFDQNILNELKRRGHKMKCIPYGGSIVQAIEWRQQEKQYWANCDIRKGGNPHGY